MNAIELLSAKYNFPVEEAMTLFTTKPNKNTKKNAKKEGQSLQDMFAELVNDVEQDNRGVVIETVVVDPAPVDELKKALMASEKKEALAAMKEQKKFDELAAKEAAKKQKEEEKAAAKEAAKKQKEEEKAALLKQKEEEKAAAKAALLKQKEEEKAAAKEALLKQKEEEKAALKKQKDEEKAALKKQKDEEKAALKEPKAVKEKVVKEKVVKEPKAKAEKVVKEPKAKAEKAVKTKDDYSPERQSPAFLPNPAELPPVKVTVTRIKIDDQTYLKSAAGILYNAETKEEVGLHDEATNTIKPLPDDEEEELEEDEYAEDN
jgi:colicin import membrane protein